MKIALGSDHGGYALKCDIIQLLEKLGHEYKDFGCYSTESCDYPDFGEAAAQAVASGECERGIVICTTGIGISIAANKVQGIRCAHCADPLSGGDDPPPQQRQYAGHGRRASPARTWPSGWWRCSSPRTLRVAGMSGA